jgi:hypothetical protein
MDRIGLALQQAQPNWHAVFTDLATTLSTPIDSSDATQIRILALAADLNRARATCAAAIRSSVAAVFGALGALLTSVTAVPAPSIQQQDTTVNKAREKRRKSKAIVNDATQTLDAPNADHLEPLLLAFISLYSTLQERHPNQRKACFIGIGFQFAPVGSLTLSVT